MGSYIIRRLIMFVPMLLITTFLIYAGLEYMPGDAVSFVAGPEAMASLDPARLEELREELGLNDPFFVRYLGWLGGILTGNFGFSLSSGVPISEIMAQRLPATLELSIAALLISTLVGIVLGVISAQRRDSATDNSLTVFGMVGLSVPDFFFALVLVAVFSLGLGWFPAGGRASPGDTTFLDRLDNLVLPALALGIAMAAGVMRYTRSSMLDVESKAFVTTARSKGMPEWRVDILHGLRVALTPVIVLVGFRLPMLIGGSVVIEQIFQWPGIGTEFISAVRSQDYPVVMIVALLSVTAVLMASLVIDILTALIDPRVRLD